MQFGFRSRRKTNAIYLLTPFHKKTQGQKRLYKRLHKPREGTLVVPKTQSRAGEVVMYHKAHVR